jgi:hypothetical protein
MTVRKIITVGDGMHQLLLCSSNRPRNQRLKKYGRWTRIDDVIVGRLVEPDDYRGET